jgi:hypothetical protein
MRRKASGGRLGFVIVRRILADEREESVRYCNYKRFAGRQQRDGAHGSRRIAKGFAAKSRKNREKKKQKRANE